MRLRSIFRLFSAVAILTVIQVFPSFASLGVIECPKYCNIRQSPSTSSKVVGLIPDGGEVDVQRIGDDWCAVKSGTVSGYIMTEYLLFGDDAVERKEKIATTKAEIVDLGVIYSSMNVNSKVWERAGSGAVYNVISHDGNWVQVDLDGGTGYILESQVVIYDGLETARPSYETVDGVRGELVHNAMQYLGNRYVWGGNDPHTGADCSGFVKYVYKDVTGIVLPRTSYTMCYSGEKITSLQMRPGDLIFYADASGTVGHVAMYIGNGTIIHAASTKSGIKLDAWNYRTPKYIRNIIGD